MYINMSKIDVKDRKILYELDINARQSYSQIGRKVGLTKNAVANRVKKLENEGVIQNYYTVIDSFKLGYFVLRFYAKFQYTTPAIESEIIEYLKKCKNIFVIDSILEKYDLSVILWVKSIKNFFILWSDILNRYGDYFQDQVLSFFITADSYRSTYLINKYKRESNEIFDVTGCGEIKKINDLDFKILQLIASNARMPITEIAKKLNSTTAQIKYRIEKLIKMDIIQGFRVNINIIKFGYQWYKIDIQLREYKKRSKIIEYIKTNPYLLCVMTTTGLSHLELEFHLENMNLIYEIMKDIKDKFPNAIKNYSFFSIRQSHKLCYMPEI